MYLRFQRVAHHENSEPLPALYSAKYGGRAGINSGGQLTNHWIQEIYALSYLNGKESVSWVSQFQVMLEKVKRNENIAVWPWSPVTYIFANQLIKGNKIWWGYLPDWKNDQSLRVVIPAGALGVADANSDPRGLFLLCEEYQSGELQLEESLVIHSELDRPILGFSVNGMAGANAFAHGGGSTTCCGDIRGKSWGRLDIEYDSRSV